VRDQADRRQPRQATTPQWVFFPQRRRGAEFWILLRNPPLVASQRDSICLIVTGWNAEEPPNLCNSVLLCRSNQRPLGPDGLAGYDSANGASFSSRRGKGIGRAGLNVRRPPSIQVGVDDSNIGGSAGRECAAVQAQEAGGLDGKQGDKAGRSMALDLWTRMSRKRPNSVSRRRCEGGHVEFHLLFVGAMRGVIAGQNGDDANLRCLDEGVDIRAGAQRRIHLKLVS